MANGGPLDDILSLGAGQGPPGAAQGPISPAQQGAALSNQAAGGQPSGAGVGGGGIAGALSGSGLTAGAGLVLGAGQLITGLVQQGKARQDIPSGESPLLQQSLRDVSARRRSFQTGAAFGSSVDRFDRQSSNVLRKAAGRSGSVGELSQIIGQLGAQRSDFLSGLEQQSQGAQNQLLQQQIGINQQLDTLRRSAQLLRFQEKSQRAASNITAGADAIGGSLATIDEAGEKALGALI